MAAELTICLDGWRGYFAFCQTPVSFGTRRVVHDGSDASCGNNGNVADADLRTALSRGRVDLAAQTAGSLHGPRPIESQPGAQLRVSRCHFELARRPPRLPLPRCLTVGRRRVRTRMHGGVTGMAGDRPPMVDYWPEKRLAVVADPFAD